MFKREGDEREEERKARVRVGEREARRESARRRKRYEGGGGEI